MTSEPQHPPTELVEHWLWTRRLAAHLVGDSSVADDVAQDAWLRAERHPGARASRGFLGTVVRNLVRERARGDRHRADRERQGAARESSPPPDEILAAAETGQELATAVLALPAPIRDALLMRYFEGMSAAKIARATGTPEGTVRSRIKRGLDALRERFEGNAGQSRLMALAGVPGAGVAGVAGASTLPVTRVAVAAAMVAATWVAVILVRAEPPTDVREVAVERSGLVDETLGSADLSAPSSATGRDALDTNEPVDPVLEDDLAIVVGRCVDEWHRPLAGARVAFSTTARGTCKPEQAALTAADGSFRVEIELDPSVHLWVEGSPYRARRDFFFQPSGASVARSLDAGVRDIGDIVVPPRGAVSARIVDPDGNALEGVPVHVASLSGTFAGQARSDEHGEILIDQLRVSAVRVSVFDDWDRVMVDQETEIVAGRTSALGTLVAVPPPGESVVIMDSEESSEAEMTDETRPRATIRGRILRAGSGAPGVVVVLRRMMGRDRQRNPLAFMSETIAKDLEAAEEFWTHHDSGKQAVTDDAGYFEFESVECDLGHELMACAESDHVRLLPVLPRGERLDLGDLQLVPYAELTLRVLAPEGLTASEFECRALPLHRNLRIASDGEALIHLPPIPAGLHTFAIQPIPGRLDAGVVVRVDLRPGESRILDVDAREHGICQVHVRSAIGDEALPRGKVLLAAEGARLPVIAREKDQDVVPYEIVRWSGDETTAFVRAIGPVQLGFIDGRGRTLALDAPPLSLRSQAEVELTLDLTGSAALDLTLPESLVPESNGAVTIECAGGTVVLPVADGRLQPASWGVDRLGDGRMRLRGLMPGVTQVRISAVAMPAADSDGSFATTSVESTVELLPGETATLDLAETKPGPR